MVSLLLISMEPSALYYIYFIYKLGKMVQENLFNILTIN